MMEVWNSHGKWEVPKPYLIGGSADPMLVCIGDAQILTFFNLVYHMILNKMYMNRTKSKPEACFPCASCLLACKNFFPLLYKERRATMGKGAGASTFF